MAHTGPYKSGEGIHEKVDPWVDKACDELDVDLYLNGHSHRYTRSTVRNREKVKLGEGTTYVVGGKTTRVPGTVADEPEGEVESGRSQYMTLTAEDKNRPVLHKVTISEDHIMLDAYQCALKPADENGVQEFDYDTWTVLDHFEITTSLHEKADEPAKEPEVQPQEPETKPQEPATSAEYYVVQPGDNLSKIAAQFGTTWRAIYDLNKAAIKDPNLIYPQQKLRIK